MGVDFYTCAKCGETFPDCGEWQLCENGHYIGPCCMNHKAERTASGEVRLEDCPCCRQGGTEEERQAKRITALEAEVAKLVRALDEAVKFLEAVEQWAFSWDGDCGVSRYASEKLTEIEALRGREG